MNICLINDFNNYDREEENGNSFYYNYEGILKIINICLLEIVFILLKQQMKLIKFSSNLGFNRIQFPCCIMEKIIYII